MLAHASARAWRRAAGVLWLATAAMAPFASAAQPSDASAIRRLAEDAAWRAVVPSAPAEGREIGHTDPARTELRPDGAAAHVSVVVHAPSGTTRCAVSLERPAGGWRVTATVCPEVDE